MRTVIGSNGWIFATCAGLLAILFFLAFTSDQGFVQNDRLRQQAAGSYEARSTLQQLLTLHQDLEIGQRGYVLTGATRFLDPYESAERRINPALRAFQRQSRGGSTRSFEELRRASLAKRRFVARTIALVRAGGRDEATRLIAAGEGKRTMDRIRVLVAELAQDEQRRLDARIAAAAEGRAALRRRTLALEIGLIGLLILASFLIARSQWLLKGMHRRAQNLAARQEAIFDSANDGMIVLNPSGSIESLNPSAASMFGAAPEQLLRRDIGALFEVAPDRGRIETFLRRLNANRKETYGQIQEFVGRHSDGTTFPVEVSVSPVRLADTTLFLAVVRNISERREVERLKSEFVATVSHELRTPLTSIAGSLGLISGGAAGEISPKVERLIAIAHSNAARLVRLINDILDMEKIEAGRMPFDIRPLALRPVLEQVVQQSAGFAAEYGVSLLIEPFGADAGVMADEDRLMQVVTNLVSNAIKFSPRGECVTLCVRPLDRRYRISVADRGAGIPEAFRDRIFGKFAQADGSDSRQKGGTGLGLSIVREIVVRSGGTVSFESREGAGSTFHVDLPAAPSPSLPSGARARADGGDVSLPTILHVDDDPDMLAVVSGVFEGKALVHSTPSVGEARALIRRNHYDAAILDVGMLDGCGTDLVAPLRKESPALPVILFTAQEVDTRPGEVDLILVKSRASLDQLVREALDRIASTPRNRKGRE